MKQFMELLKRAFRSRMFTVVAVLLFVSAIGLNGATKWMELTFRKVPVEPARRLDLVAATIGGWRQVSQDQPLEADMQEALGTQRYIFRDYVDVSVLGRDTLDDWMSKPVLERRQKLARFEQEHPEAVVHFALTYYTGLVDTVAHIPERCYVAGGFEPAASKEEDWPIMATPVPVRYISFEDVTGFNSSIARNVVYFFNVNGEFTSSNITVRRRLQNLLVRHGFYAKVEAMCLAKDRAKAQRTLAAFLTAAMPEVMLCLPDFQKVESGQATASAK